MVRGDTSGWDVYIGDLVKRCARIYTRGLPVVVHHDRRINDRMVMCRDRGAWAGDGDGGRGTIKS